MIRLPRISMNVWKVGLIKPLWIGILISTYCEFAAFKKCSRAVSYSLGSHRHPLPFFGLSQHPLFSRGSFFNAPREPCCCLHTIKPSDQRFPPIGINHWTSHWLLWCSLKKVRVATEDVDEVFIIYLAYVRTARAQNANRMPYSYQHSTIGAYLVLLLLYHGETLSAMLPTAATRSN